MPTLSYSQGRLPFALGHPGKPLSRRIVINKDALSIIAALKPAAVHRQWFGHYVEADARCILGVHARDADRLAPLRVGTKGTTKHHDRTTVLRLASSYASRSELMARSGLQSKPLQKLLRDANVAETPPYGWARDEAVSAVS